MLPAPGERPVVIEQLIALMRDSKDTEVQQHCVLALSNLMCHAPSHGAVIGAGAIAVFKDLCASFICGARSAQTEFTCSCCVTAFFNMSSVAESCARVAAVGVAETLVLILRDDNNECQPQQVSLAARTMCAAALGNLTRVALLDDADADAAVSPLVRLLDQGELQCVAGAMFNLGTYIRL